MSVGDGLHVDSQSETRGILHTLYTNSDDVCGDNNANCCRGNVLITFCSSVKYYEFQLLVVT